MYESVKIRVLSLMEKGKIEVCVLLRRKTSKFFMVMENLNLNLIHSKLFHKQEYKTPTFSAC